MPDTDLPDDLARFPLLDAILQRRSRRFALGAELRGGPLAHTSRHAPVPLEVREEGWLAFAGAGLTGDALADLPYAEGGLDPAGGEILATLLGRTVASPDALHGVALFVVNDGGAFFLPRPQDAPPERRAAWLDLARRRRFADLYASWRVRIADRRVDVPREVPYVPPFNRWSANVPGSSYFVPVNELSALYVNVLLSMFGEGFGFAVVDEHDGFRPAGIGKFLRSRGGHLQDDPAAGRVVTIQHLESWLLEFAAIEQGFVLQNLQLAAEAAGLGGFPHFAAHPFAWFEAFGFRMARMRASKLLRAGRLATIGMRALGRDVEVPVPVGLERDGRPLLRPFTPPYFASMESAVRAFVDGKMSRASGTLRGEDAGGGWKDSASVRAAIPDYSDAAVDATVAYCEHVWRRYGRFPAYFGPFRTVLAFQAHHLDLEFYDRHYARGAVGESHRRHLESWHG